MHASKRRATQAVRWGMWGACLCLPSACSDSHAAHSAAPQSEPLGEEADVGESRAPLLGGTFFADDVVKSGDQTELGCNEDDRAMFRQIMLLGRTVALGNAIGECVRFIMTEGDGTFGPYHPCSNDPYPHDAVATQVEGVLRMLTTPHAVEITCTTGNIGITRIAGSYELPLGLREPFDIPNPPLAQLYDATWLSNAAYASAATHDEADFRARIALIAPRSALVWHEAMHVHAYRHDCSHQTYFQSVPYMVQYCLQQVAQRSADFCDMRRACPIGGQQALIDSYPISHSTGCECVRDAVGQGQGDIAATPQLDKPERDDAFGFALAAGDFDGDGFEDLAVGAPGEDHDAGRVFIYHGSIFGLYAERVLDQSELDQNEPGDRFGFALTAMDFDGDQIVDLVVGAPGEDAEQGAVYVFRGSRRGLVPEHALTPRTKGPQRFGEALAAGPLLDEPRPVLAVGAPGLANATGRVALFGAQAENEGLLEWRADVVPGESSSSRAGDRMGAALAFGALADTKQPMLAIGAPGADGRGAVYVLRSLTSRSLPANGQLPATYRVLPRHDGVRAFGQTLSLGRTLGPGTLVVAAPESATAHADSAGRVFFFRALANRAEPLQNLIGAPPSQAFGSALLSTGRRFLHDELLVTSHSQHAGLALAKAAFDTQQGTFFTTLTEGPRVARPGALVHGDFDGNGTLDLAVGLPDDNPDGRTPRAGAVHLFHRNDYGAWSPWGRYRQGD